MMEIKRILFVVACCFVMSAPAFGQDMIGVTGGNDRFDDPQSVLAINSTTADAVVLASPGYPGRGLAGVAVNSYGRVFAVTGSASFDDPNAYLLELDPVTGQVIEEVGVLMNGAGQTGTIGDLSFQPGTDILFGIASNGRNDQFGDLDGGELMTIDTNTALVTFIGKDPSTNNDNGGLAFAPDGTLYFVSGWNDRGLFIIDPATGLYLDNIDTDSQAMGLAVSPEGVLFGVTHYGDADEAGNLHQIDRQTGEVTEIGYTGWHYVHDIDFITKTVTPVPAMGDWALAVLVLLVLFGGALLVRKGEMTT